MNTSGNEKIILGDLILISDNIKGFSLFNSKLFLLTNNDILLYFTEHNSLKIISINSKFSIQKLKEYAKKNSYFINEEVIVYNDSNKSIGWYLINNSNGSMQLILGNIKEDLFI